MQSSIFSSKFSRNILYNVSVYVAILSLAQLFNQRLHCIVMEEKHFEICEICKETIFLLNKNRFFEHIYQVT